MPGAKRVFERGPRVTAFPTILLPMPRRLPWTIWLYLSWDLWRLVLLTAAVLVTVLAFAAAVKPLADGKLGPADTIRFMLLIMPPMLQYALPFAACFGATLAYHRWAADNELTACHAGGVSHRALLAPAIGAGVLISLVLLVLSNFAIPRLLRLSTELITADAPKLIENAIKQGESIRFGDDGRVLYADQVVRQGPDPASGAFERLWLGGLLIVKLDKQGNVEEQVSAREASVWLRRVSAAGGADGSGESMTEVVIRPRDATFEVKGTRGELGETIKPALFRNTFADDPKFLSFPELRGLRHRPEIIGPVDRRRRDLALVMAQRAGIDAITRDLRGPAHEARFTDNLGQTVVVKAGDLRPARTRNKQGKPGGPSATIFQIRPLQRNQPIVVERTLSDGRVQRWAATGGEIHLPRGGSPTAAVPGLVAGGGADAGPRVLVTVILKEAAAQELDEAGDLIVIDDDAPAASGAASEYTFKELTPQSDPARELLAMPAWSLIETAGKRAAVNRAEHEQIGRPLADLTNRIQDLLREALSKEHERYAMSAACLVMVLIGTIMAMRLRHALPLTIYLWAFFPALATVITISAGQQFTHSHGLVGLTLLWGGVLALGSFAGWEFVKLVRH